MLRATLGGALVTRQCSIVSGLTGAGSAPKKVPVWEGPGAPPWAHLWASLDLVHLMSGEY